MYLQYSTVLLHRLLLHKYFTFISSKEITIQLHFLLSYLRLTQL